MRAKDAQPARVSENMTLNSYLLILTNYLYLVDGDNEAGGYLIINAIIIQSKKGVKEML